MKIAGVDGCRAGWLMLKQDGNNYSFGIYENINQLLDANTDLDRLLIDIPIGLSSRGFIRTVEQRMREALPGRAATVFNPPCRDACYELDNQRARAINLQIEGKSLSVQSLNIRDKIRQVDQLLIEEKAPFPIYESHPELCFKYLNKAKVLHSKKSTIKGIQERLDLINKFDTALYELYFKMLKQSKRKDVKKDDILDAMCLCLVNRLAGEGSLSFIEDEKNRDQKGLFIKIAYFSPS